MTDPIDEALADIQALCKTSWSENEIVRRIGEVRDLRKDEFRRTLAHQAKAERPVWPKSNERWG